MELFSPHLMRVMSTVEMMRTKTTGGGCRLCRKQGDMARRINYDQNFFSQALRIILLTHLLFPTLLLLRHTHKHQPSFSGFTRYWYLAMFVRRSIEM